MNRVKTALTLGATGSSCWGLDYSYDIYANLKTVTLDSARPSCTWTNLSIGIDTNNRVTSTGFSYDAAGNVLSDGSFSYTWDAESELKTAASITYTYDGDGRRVQKSNGKLYWYGATGDILDESDASGNITDEFVFFGGKRIARRNISTGNIYYYLADHLGTARMIVQAGATSACYDADFDPFGGEHIITNTCPQNYKFTGKERDSETGLDDFEARYYSSQFGRFHSFDWSAIPAPVPYADLGNPQTLNLYAYVKDNPLNLTDPTGHMARGSVSSSEGMYIVASRTTNPLSTEPSFSTWGGGNDVTWEVTVNGEGAGIYFADKDAADAFVASAQKALGQEPPAPQNQNSTLTLGDGNKSVTVDIAFTPYRSGNAQGVEIDIQTKDCGDCRYVQTVSASDHPARVDTERDANGKPISPSYPLYPSQQKPGEFYDSPQRTTASSSFSAVVSVGTASGKSFKSLGSITYGFSIDAKGKLSVTAPRVATKREAAGSAAVVRKEVPGFSFQ